MEEEATVFDTLAATPLAVLLRETAWAYPVLETLHILGIALVLGGILMLDLRLLGFNRDISVSALSRHILPWVVLGIVGNAISGTLLFISDAAEFAANVSLRAKLLLIALALANALVYQRTIARTVSSWDRGVTPPRAARLQGALSSLLWIAVVTAGRMMAYIK